MINAAAPSFYARTHYQRSPCLLLFLKEWQALSARSPSWWHGDVRLFRRNDYWIAFALGDGDGDDFFCQPTIFLRCCRFVLAHSKGVLIFSADLEIFCDVFAGLRHGIDTVLFLHQRVYEPPADGGIVDLGIA